MNIFITCDRLDCLGGLEEHVINKVKYLLKKGHKVHLDCNAISEYYMNQIKHENLSISSPWSDNWSHVLDDICGFEPDVIHAHPFSAINRGYIVKGKFRKAKFFITIHGEYGYTVPHLICMETNNIILVNDKIKNYAAYDTVLIPNGIDTKRFKFRISKKCADINKRIITIVTRLQDNKEIPVFEFLKYSNELLCNTYIKIIGSGKYLDEIKEKTNELQKEQHYVFYDVLGEVSNVEKYMQESDLVLGCDRVALEALCCGTDVFYMGQGHWKDLVTFENYEDYLFSNKGKETYEGNELIDSIMYVLCRRDGIGIQHKLYNTIRNKYSLDAQMEQIIKLYEG